MSDSFIKKLQLLTQILVPFGIRIDNGDIISCQQICKKLLLKIEDLQITQDFLYPFELGEVDVILGIQRLATLNTVQAIYGKRFMIITINGCEYELQGLHINRNLEPHNSATCHHLAIETYKEQLIIETDPFSLNQLEDKSFYQWDSSL